MSKKTKQQGYVVPSPVTPYPDLLPLGGPNIPWERFEAFCEDFISRLETVQSCHRYGGQGSRQRGIDIFADLKDGKRWAFQCRQYKQFTPAQAKRTIENTTYKADYYIALISCKATSSVRDVFDKYPNWDVWDVHDISREVRRLKIDSSARLVETHFGPTWRKAFLGLAGLSPFVTPQDFFRPLLNPANLFNHTWLLVGRKEFLNQLHAFVDNEQSRVAIIKGRGAIGKTKLLHAFAEEFPIKHQSYTLWFAVEGVPITASGIDYLPIEPCVIVVDDAHRRDDLPVMIALIHQRPQPTKLVLSCRPQGKEYLRPLLTQGNINVREVTELEELKELNRDETKELAIQALGKEYSHLADHLVSVTLDSPLVTVVGGRLLAEKQILPDLLERDEEFRRTVLTRFSDVILGQVGDRIDSGLCKAIVDLIATIQPIRIDSEQFQQVAAELLNIDRPKLVSSIGILEEAGVLLRRGYTLRITPDVLGDHILHEACLTPQGQPTGYAREVFEKFATVCPSETLRNLAELDWRIHQSSVKETNLLVDIWQEIEEEFKRAPNSGRCYILTILKKVALYQPGRVLALVEYAMHNPTTTPEVKKLSRLYQYTHANVLNELPELLREISYTLDYLPRCCDLLWEFGRDDGRPLNQHPEHPIRVLADLANYEFNKPLVVNQTLLDAVECWLKEADVHNHIHSPLDIVDPILAKTSLSTRREDYKIVWHPTVVSRDKTQSIRERALQLVVQCAFSERLKVVLRALKTLDEALREPHGFFGQEISKDDREQWRPEQIQILDQISKLAEQPIDPLVHLHILETLIWHSRHSQSDEVKQKARAICNSIPDSFELRLTKVLKQSYDWEWSIEEGEDEQEWYKDRLQKAEQKRRAVAEEFLQKYQNADDGKQILNESLHTMKSCSVHPEPQLFLGELGHLDPNYAALMCEAIIKEPDCPLSEYISPLLYNVRALDVDRALTLNKKALDSGNLYFCFSVAQVYSGSFWAENPEPGDLEIVNQLLIHPDLRIKRIAIDSLRMLGRFKTRLAIDMMLTVDIGESMELASEMCEAFGEKFGIPPDTLNPDDIKGLLSKLEIVKNIDDYHISEFLALMSKKDACSVVQLLMNRVARSEAEGSDYQPLPYLGFHHSLSGLADSEDFHMLLREVRDCALKSTWQFHFWIPKLFKEVSLGHSAEGLKILGEWIDTGEAVKIEAASLLLSEADSSFVFSHVDFVSNMLELANNAGDECYKRVSSNLLRSSVSGTRSGIPGIPMPQDVALRGQASATAGRYIVGSPTHRFYISLVKYADASIQDQLARDEEMLD